MQTEELFKCQIKALECRNQEIRKMIGKFIEMLPEIKKMYEDPFHSDLINKAYKNIIENPHEITKETVNTVILSVEAINCCSLKINL